MENRGFWAKEEALLGMNRRITRRDFLNAGLLAAGAAAQL
jgi:hypothetical protein